MNARRVVGWVLAAAFMGVLVALSRFSLPLQGPDHALLRLSWQIQGQTLNDCRTLTPEELERLPVHMRNPDACRGRVAPYRLEVTVDGEVRVVDTVRAPGARADRPLSVYRDLPTAPGAHDLRVVFEPLLGEEAPDTAAPLTFDGRVVLEPRQIVLITHLEHQGVLVAKGS